MADFQFGSLCATRGVADTAADNPAFYSFIWRSIARYRQGDWGDLSELDKAMNNEAVRLGDERILAAYSYPEHPEWRIWIITEADRSATTVLFPDEY